MTDHQAPRVAVVGAGSFGAEHARAFREAGARVVGVVDPDPARAEALAQEVGASAYGALDQLLAAEDIDGISIAASGAVHPYLVAEGLAAGLKILVEKPVAPTADQVRTLRGLPGADELVVPAHVLRFDQAHRALRGHLPRLGRLSVITAHRYRDQQHSVDYPTEHPALLTMVHDIDLCLWLTGQRVAEVTAIGNGDRMPSGCDVLSVRARTEDGVLCELRSAWVLPASSPERDRLEVLGDHGMLTLERTGSSLRFTTVLDDAPATEATFDFAPLAQEFAETTAWLRGGPRPEVRLSEAEHGLEVAEAVISSAAQDGQTVRLPVPRG